MPNKVVDGRIQFELEEKCSHGCPGIQATDIPIWVCRVVRQVMTNQNSDSTDYKVLQGMTAFLQGYDYEADKNDESTGWVLIEVWESRDDEFKKLGNYSSLAKESSRAKTVALVEYINKRIREAKPEEYSCFIRHWYQ